MELSIKSYGDFTGPWLELEPLYEPKATFSRDENCMANRVVAAKGELLPITAEAFAGYPQGSTISIWTSDRHSDAKSFLESLGIIIGAAASAPGWHICQLPEGWYVELKSFPTSRDESVYFIAADGTKQFHLITLKNASDTSGYVIPAHRSASELISA